MPGRPGSRDVGGRMQREGAVRQDTAVLRRRDSPESKPVIAPHGQTGEEG